MKRGGNYLVKVELATKTRQAEWQEGARGESRRVLPVRLECFFCFASYKKATNAAVSAAASVCFGYRLHDHDSSVCPPPRPPPTN